MLKNRSLPLFLKEKLNISKKTKTIIEKIASIRKYLYSHHLVVIFSLGILLRFIAFLFQSPFNDDDHFGVVQYIYNHHTIPISNQLSESYQPPLYYLLASLFFPAGARITQFISSISSIAALYIIYCLIQKCEFIRTREKKYCLLLASLLPQFVVFGNYISNDSLSFFIGSLIFFQIWKYVTRPNMINQNILAIYLGLGLLTKGTFLSFIPILILLVVLTNIRKRIGLKWSIISFLSFVSIFLTVGSYKYVENIITHQRPIVHNLDANPSWAKLQRTTYKGLSSFYDVNILKLCKYPTVSNHTSHSYPLMLYGTFWYQYIQQLNFFGNTTKSEYLGKYIYILAILPTLLFFIGVFRILFSIRSTFICEKLYESFNASFYESVSLFLLLSNLILVIITGIKYDVWSCFQSRYLFPSFFSIIILFNSGLDYLRGRHAIVQEVVYALLRCLFLLFILYFIIEVANNVPIVSIIDNLSYGSNL